MRSILFALSVATVMAREKGICQKNCALDFGKCLITTGQFNECLKTEGVCTLDCFKSKSIKNHIKNVHVNQDKPDWRNDCQKQCGDDFGRCVLITYDVYGCSNA
jgi:hypothetical protein